MLGVSTDERRIKGLKDLNLKKEPVVEELRLLEISLGQLVINYVNVLYSERTLCNARELWKMISLHVLNDLLRDDRPRSTI